MNAIVITINGNTPVSDKCITEIANKIAKAIGKTIDDIEIATIDNESLAKLLAKTAIKEKDENNHQVSETVTHAVNYLQSMVCNPKNNSTVFISKLMSATGEGLFVNKEKGIILRNALEIIIKTHHKGSNDAIYLNNLGYTDKVIDACSKCYDLLNTI